MGTGGSLHCQAHLLIGCRLEGRRSEVWRRSNSNVGRWSQVLECNGLLGLLCLLQLLLLALLLLEERAVAQRLLVGRRCCGGSRSCSLGSTDRLLQKHEVRVNGRTQQNIQLHSSWAFVGKSIVEQCPEHFC